MRRVVLCNVDRSGGMLFGVCACLSLLMVSFAADPLQYSTSNLANCVEAKHQRHINAIELMGIWNVIEVIEHSDRYMDRRNYLRTVTRSYSCPVIHFAIDSERDIRMLWNDEDGYIQYTFIMTNMNNPGFWISPGFQSGTMVDSSYEHFSGTAQVMKAVQSHMVLTFCSPNDRHFSIILARNKYLSHDEIRGVHKLLNRVSLPLVAVQGYCNKAGVSATPSAMLGVLLSLVFLASKLVTS